MGLDGELADRPRRSPCGPRTRAHAADRCWREQPALRVFRDCRNLAPGRKSGNWPQRPRRLERTVPRQAGRQRRSPTTPMMIELGVRVLRCCLAPHRSRLPHRTPRPGQKVRASSSSTMTTPRGSTIFNIRDVLAAFLPRRPQRLEVRATTPRRDLVVAGWHAETRPCLRARASGARDRSRGSTSD